MARRPHALAPVPEETARVARAAFPTGHPYLLLRDTLGTSVQDDDCPALVPRGGPPRLPPWRLALVTLRLWRANLAGRQAAAAVRARIAWQDLLGLGTVWK
jgi:transposase